MADPLSVAGSVVGLILLGIQPLLKAFDSLERVISNRSFQKDEQNLIKKTETSINECDE